MIVRDGLRRTVDYGPLPAVSHGAQVRLFAIVAAPGPDSDVERQRRHRASRPKPARREGAVLACSVCGAECRQGRGMVRLYCNRVCQMRAYRARKAAQG